MIRQAAFLEKRKMLKGGLHCHTTRSDGRLSPEETIRLHVENGYDLSINKYKKTEYKPVEYPPTSEIIAELKELERQIQQGLEELEGMV